MFKPPKLEEVRQYVEANKYRVDPEMWMDFYESKGWMVGRNKMVSWPAAVRTWHRKNKTEAVKESTKLKKSPDVDETDEYLAMLMKEIR